MTIQYILTSTVLKLEELFLYARYRTWTYFYGYINHSSCHWAMGRRRDLSDKIIHNGFAQHDLILWIRSKTF